MIPKMKVKCPHCSKELQTAGWLSKAGKSRWKGVTSKQRSSMAKKGWETRRSAKPPQSTNVVPQKRTPPSKPDTVASKLEFFKNKTTDDNEGLQ